MLRKSLISSLLFFLVVPVFADTVVNPFTGRLDEIGTGGGTTTGGGGGDNLGNHVATMTIQAPFGIVAGSVTINNQLVAGGSAGNLGQVLVSNGANAAPTFVDPVVSQPSPELLRSTVFINPSSNTVTVGNFPATQPISGAVSVSNFPATQPISGAVSVSNFPASQAVTGTFFQVTQPISIAAPVVVSGLNSITTTYVVNPTTVTFNGIAQPVTGTFFQATQPVSIAAPVTVAGLNSVTTTYVVNPTTVTQGTAGLDTAGWPVVAGVVAAGAAAWTSATTIDTALTIATKDYGTVVIGYNPTGSITGGVLNFEVSDDGGTTWYLAPVTILNATPSATTIFGINGQVKTTFQGNIAGYTNFRVRLNPALVGTGTANVRIQASSFVSNTYVVPLQNNANSLKVQLSDGTNSSVLNSAGALSVNTIAANLAVTATAATGVAVTATLPAVASQFHYITLLEIHKFFTVANVASATPLVCTTTNLPGSLAYTFGQPLGTVGSTDDRIYASHSPLKSSVVNTATTVVCPATTGIIWRINVYYFAGT